MAELVEMDMRGLVAGAHFATARVSELVEATGPEKFATSLTAIRDLTEAELRRRISRIADGSYRITSWTEFLTEFYKVPCTLTVKGDTLTFDYEGASPQCKRYFNSKPYIIAAELVVMIYRLIAPDLPFNDGMFEPITLLCPEGSIVNSMPPAPIAAAHMHVGLNASGVGLEALMLALSASPESEFHQRTGGASWDSAIGVQLWTWTDQQGRPDAYLTFEGLWAGSSGGAARDGNDHGRNVMGPPVEASYPDIEVLESWFPLLFTERAVRGGTEGAGTFRAGGGNQFAFRPHGVDTLHGVTFGTRRWMPLQGFAGGRPGACNEFVIHRADGTDKMIDVSTSGEMIHEGDWYEVRLAGGGGFGDPFDRDPAMVERDVRRERLTAEEARSAYGVIIGDPASTDRLRDEMRQARLARATPAPKPLSRDDVTIAGEAVPLYAGIVHHGPVAVAAISGAPLAIAPDPWTAGCPMIEERRWDATGPDVVYRTWLDPETGRSLHVEVALAGETDGFHVAPKHWVEAA
jgi:N-methylhydantoinase B